MRVVAAILLPTLLLGCASASTPGPSPSLSASVAVSPSVDAIRTLPPSQVAVEPGTYTWEEFSPAVSFEVGPGWEVGHRNPEFFDLFVDGDFPAVSFGRFVDVFTDDTTRVPARDAANVIASLSTRPDVTLSAPQSAQMGGLRGQAFTLSVATDQTPLFGGRNGVFRMDPGFETRYTALDVPGDGVIFVGVAAREGELDAALDAAAPILATLTVAD